MTLAVQPMKRWFLAFLLLGVGKEGVYAGSIPIEPKIVNEYTVFTVAGGNGIGHRDGPGSQATFFRDEALAAAPDGSIYVGDTENRLLRRVAPDGTVTTVAGQPGVREVIDGRGSKAAFGGACGVAVAPDGTVYVADGKANVVRKVSPDGVVQTVAGQPWQEGYRDGPAQEALFHVVAGVAVAPDGSVIIADRKNHVIRCLRPDGLVTTLAGQPGRKGYQDGPAHQALFFEPAAVAVGPHGNIYIADTRNHCIRCLTTNGVVRTVAGGPGPPGFADGPGRVARFWYPRGVAVDSRGYIWVADTGNHVLRRISPDGVVSTPAGQVGVRGLLDGTGSSARFRELRGVAVDAQDRVWIADTWNHAVRVAVPGLADPVWQDPAIARPGDTRSFGFQPKTATNWTWSVICCPPEVRPPPLNPKATNQTVRLPALGRYTFRLVQQNKLGLPGIRHVEFLVLDSRRLRLVVQQDGSMKLIVPTGPRIDCIVQASSNLRTWWRLKVLWTKQTQITFIDTNALPHRFYRVFYQPGP